MEIKRDLEAGQIIFAMHDILSRSERYSQADLIVLDLLGDIKSSTYFLQGQADEPLSNDFYTPPQHIITFLLGYKMLFYGAAQYTLPGSTKRGTPRH